MVNITYIIYILKTRFSDFYINVIFKITLYSGKLQKQTNKNDQMEIQN